MDRDRNLLFGVFAVQLRQVQPSDIMVAAAAWAADPSKDFPDRLVANGAISSQQRAFIEGLVEQAVRAHNGDAKAVIATVGGAEQVAQSFAGTIDPTQLGPDMPTRPGARPIIHDFDLPDSFKAVQETPGRYSHLGEHARGGMGRVLLVHDAFLGRDVALKELLPRPILTDTEHQPQGTPMQQYMDQLSRFLLEARITGQLEHPSIVPVYELGHRSDGALYYTMKLVRGTTLSQAIRKAGSLQARLALLSHFVDLCQAIAYAHSRRVIHRDIKPQNVMVGEFGETVVLDWGLARRGDKDDVHSDGLAETLRLMNLGDVEAAEKTAYGQILGTPAYMPPEQAKGQLDSVNERSDVYGLGTVLYEMLTGKPPYEGGSVRKVLGKVITETPLPIRSVEPKVPSELAAICERAMQKNPADRYSAAKELANEIQRFQSGALVQAYRYTKSERVARFVARNKAYVATAIAVVFLLTGFGTYSFVRVYQAGKREFTQRLAAEAAQRNEEQARKRAEQIGYASSVLLADALVQKHEYIGAQEALWQTPESLRGWEWGYLLRECNRDSITITGPRGGLMTAALSPDGTRICLGARQGGAAVFDVESGKLLYQVCEEWSSWTSAAFSSDGSTLLVTAIDEGSTLFDAKTGNQIGVLAAIRGRGLPKDCLSPDGIRLVQRAYRDSGTILVWDVRSGDLVSEITLPGELLNSVSLGPDAHTAVVSSMSGRGYVINLESGQTIVRFAADKVSMTDAKISPRGDYMVSGSGDGVVRVWNAVTGELVRAIKMHDEPILSVAFDSDGQRILAASRDRTVSVARVESGERVGVLVGHSNAVFDVSFDSTGSRAVTASLDGTAKIWDLDKALQPNRVDLSRLYVNRAVLSPDARHILVTTIVEDVPASSVQVFDRASGREIVAFAGFAEQVMMATYRPDGNRIAVASHNKTTYVLDAATGQVMTELHGHTNVIRHVSYSPDGTLLATASADHTARIWNGETGEPVATLTGHEGLVTEAAWSPDGNRLATVSHDGSARLWEVRTGACLASVKPVGGNRLDAVVFDRTGSACWIAGENTRIVRWDFGKQETTDDVSVHTALDLALSPDGDRLAGAGLDGAVRILNAASGQEMIRFSGPAGHVRSVAWSENGDTLIHPIVTDFVVFHEADPWRIEELDLYRGGAWRPRYNDFKRRPAPIPDLPQVPAPIVQQLTMSEPGARRRLDRLAKYLESGRNHEGNAADPPEPGVKIDADEVFPLVRRMGLLPGDVITRIAGVAVSGPAQAREALRKSLAGPLTDFDMRVRRAGRERHVRLQLRPPERTVHHVILPSWLAAMVVNTLDELRGSIPLFEPDQRASAAWEELPVDGPGIDGVYISFVQEALSSDKEARWASTLNQFLSIVKLYPGDHIVSMNGVSLGSIETVLDLIEAGGPSILGGQPYTYVLMVERSPFELVELNVEVK